MKRMTKLAAIGLTFTLLGALAGCAGPAKTAKVVATPPPSLSGKVMETMDAAGYTYIHMESQGKQIWVAAPTMKVSVGQEVALLPGAEMLDFPSKALNRTFDKIIFSGGPATAATTAPAAAAPTAMPAGHPATPGSEPAKAAALLYAGKVVETMDAGNYTYVYLEKDGHKSWGAVPRTAVKVGEEIELEPGTEMGNFTSKSLNRTFDNIIFSSGIVRK